MKFSKLSLGLGALAGALLALAATFPPVLQTRDLKLSNTSNTVALTIQKAGNATNNAVEIYSGSNLRFRVASSNTIATLKTDLGIQTGTNFLATGTNQTITFPTAFSAAPVLATSGSTTSAVFTTSITASNFVLNNGTVASGTNTIKWIAIGPP